MRIEHAYKGGYQGRSGYWLHLTYDEDGIERLKAAVPAMHRTWDEVIKRWWVADEALDEAQRVVPALEAFRAQRALL